MAKRFIDTGMFDDEWFAELSVDAKLFWIYYLTKCDHAGLLKYNKKLIEFQTGIKSIEKVVTQIGERLVMVNDLLLFCPKFIDFQYPGFPKSKVLQQESAVKLLVNVGLFDSETNTFKQLDKSKPTVDKVLPKTIVIDSVIGSDNVNGNGGASNLIFTHRSAEFLATWENWIKYRSQIKKPYKSEIAKQEALNKLGASPEKDAIQMMKNSMASQWQGLFEVDNKSEKTYGRAKDGFVQ
jgi:hypothetical protein